jgi:acetyl-CoA carboxylase biotin carboxylase subunit
VFDIVLVANRGEIARRVIRTVQSMGIKAVAVHSEADAAARHVRDADESVLLGPAPPAESYLDGVRVIEAAKQSGAQAIHPGYGFLAESAAFAQQVIDAGLTWIGPSPDAIESMGDKINARNLMSSAGVPVADGTAEPVADVDDAVREAERIGYPVMVKASAGGGGIGMGVAEDEAALRKAFETGADPGRALLRVTGRSCSSATCRAPGTSRCRSSGSPTAAWSRSASATARCSGGTRRSPRSRRRRG